MAKGGDKAVICEGLRLHHAGFFVNLFPKAAEPTEHLEVVFTPGCLTHAALLPGSTSLVCGENMLCDPQLLELSAAIPVADDRSLATYRSGVISTGTEDAISANSSSSLSAVDFCRHNGICWGLKKGYSVSQLFWQKSFALMLFIEKNCTFSTITFPMGSGFPAALQ